MHILNGFVIRRKSVRRSRSGLQKYVDVGTFTTRAYYKPQQSIPDQIPEIAQPLWKVSGDKDVVVYYTHTEDNIWGRQLLIEITQRTRHIISN